MKYLLKILMLAALASAPVVRAEVASPSVQIIVMRPTDFPLLTRVAGQSMDLHPFNNGTTYLYIEQQQVDRIVILDVTDPARVKPVGTAKLETPAPFDFIKPLGGSAALVCFRDHSGLAVIDFRKPKEPVLSHASTLLQGTRGEEIGPTAFLIVNGPGLNSENAVQDYDVVDASNPMAPRLLTTVQKVQSELLNQETGTTYLLGSAGLTIVRRPDVEKYRQGRTYSN